MEPMKGLPGRIAGMLGARASGSASPAFRHAPGVQETGDDPSQTIASALRGLRFRNTAGIGALAALCVGFVVGGHIANQRFSNATAMAVLVARAAEASSAWNSLRSPTASRLP